MESESFDTGSSSQLAPCRPPAPLDTLRINRAVLTGQEQEMESLCASESIGALPKLKNGGISVIVHRDRPKSDIGLASPDSERPSEQICIRPMQVLDFDTSVGWMAYDDAKVRELTLKAMDRGFRAIKLKVGSDDEDRDTRRAAMLREILGDSGVLMFDANQRWNAPEAKRRCAALASFKPLWIEEPTHPDDIHAHVELGRAIAPICIAAGEHIPNRVLFNNYFFYGAMHFVQADCARLAGISEFLAVSLMAKKFQLPIVPHAEGHGPDSSAFGAL
jgi:hypothetical protein